MKVFLFLFLILASSNIYAGIESRVEMDSAKTTINNDVDKKMNKITSKLKSIKDYYKKTTSKKYQTLLKISNQIKQLNKYILLEQKRQSAKLEQIKDMR